MSRPQYLFGDGDSAAQRLKLLAGVYQESTSAFLMKAAGTAHLRLALDLGCGPGFTTRLIAGTLRCDRVIGLDASAAFIELAGANSGERASFLRHDVTATPFPSEPADFIFSRFLLTHLRNPALAVAKWATQLKPGGLLLLEETEAIHTAHPPFVDYLRIVEAMLAAESNQLYAGHVVAGLNLQPELIPVTSELHPLPVQNSKAARLFLLNLQAWKESAFIQANYSRDSIMALEGALAEITTSESSHSEIEWAMRQAAWLKL